MHGDYDDCIKGTAYSATRILKSLFSINKAESLQHSSQMMRIVRRPDERLFLFLFFLKELNNVDRQQTNAVAIMKFFIHGINNAP